MIMAKMISKDEFEKMPFDSKVSYLLDNPEGLPDELAEQGVKILSQAGEIERAVVLARNKGMIGKAIELLVDSGDYLWAALIAKNAGNAEEAVKLYKEGLEYYIDREMYGRAISAATALKMPADEIDDLFRRGVLVESRGMDMGHAKAMIENAMDSLEIALIGKEDEMSKEIMGAIQSEREKAKGQEEKDK
jgi:hypothetical protein